MAHYEQSSLRLYEQPHVWDYLHDHMTRKERRRALERFQHDFEQWKERMI